MSDFLSNLAARSLGLAEFVRPQVASLFEPPRAAVASRAGILDLPSAFEEVVLDARPSAALEVSHFVEPPSPSSSQQDGRESEQVHAVGPATSDPPGQPTQGSWSASVRHTSLLAVEGGAEARPPASATRAHDPSRVSPPSMMRTGEAGTVRRSGHGSPATRPALVPDGADGGKNSSGPAWSESRRPVNEHLGASRDLRPVDVSRRQAVSPGIERDAAARSPQATAVPAARLHDIRPVVPPSVIQPSETGAFRRSGLDGPTARPVRVRDRADGGETSLSTAWREPVRPVNEGLDGSFALRPSDVSRGEPVSPSDPGTAGPARVVVQPRVALYSEPAGPARSRPTIRAEPAIQVTIGRVEVRATHPAAPVSPRERQTPTAMSLEEYLRRRAEGSPR